MERVPAYDPEAHYDLLITDTSYRRAGDLDLTVRIYQPDGPGPFPMLMDVHGGAWAAQDKLNNAVSQEALAASGLVVAAIDFRTSTVAPHPAAMQDINYAARWLKSRAGEFNGSTAGFGGIGWSSGGHQVMLHAMRPRMYADLPLEGAAGVDATLAYVVMGWPVIDPLSRYRLAQSGTAQPLTGDISTLLRNHLAYYGDEAGMIEANPQLMLERGEKVETPPALLVQGANDQQLTRMMAESFIEAYSLGGGVIEAGKYPGEPHGFMREGGINAKRGMVQVKYFIARQLAELRETADAAARSSAAGSVG